ncbi:putative tnpB [Burkholderia cepacia]|nr:putative tnpB [Burkholderia cepacia]
MRAAECERINALAREVKELRRTNEILKLASVFSPRRSSTADSSPEGVRRSASRTFWVEPLCKVLRIAPPGYRRHAAQLRDPSKRCARAKRDELLQPEIRRVWQATGLCVCRRSGNT